MADAVNEMASYALHWNPHDKIPHDKIPHDKIPVARERDPGALLNVGVGWAHNDTLPIAQAVAHAVGESAQVCEVILFRIGPSVGVETGPDAVSCVMFPA